MSPLLRVVFDLRAAQSRHHPERGIARWVANLAAALDRRTDIDLTLLIDPERELYPSYAEMLADARLVAADELDEPRRGEVMVFHLSSPFEFDIPMRELLPPRLSSPAVIRATTLYDVIPLIYPDVHDAWLMRAWRWRAELVRTADLVLAISEHTAIDGVDRLGVRHAQIRTIGTGVPSFAPPEPRTSPRERPFVLYAGGTEHPRKNVGALIEAFGRLPDSLGDHDLVIAGRVADDVETGIRRRAVDAGVENRLELTGFVSDEALSALYSECRCSVYPSTYEGFGLPIAEAMARGVPVVASRTTSCGELLTRPEAGFDPTDVDDIAAAMERVLLDRGLADALSREGLAAAAALTWDAVADRTVVAYRQKTTEQAPRRRFKARARRPTFWMLGTPDVGTPAAGTAPDGTRERRPHAGRHRHRRAAQSLSRTSASSTPVGPRAGPASSRARSSASSTRWMRSPGPVRS